MICRTKTKSKIQGSQEESLPTAVPWRASSCAWLEHLEGLHAESELLISYFYRKAGTKGTKAAV